jgi:hypothetical protein
MNTSHLISPMEWERRVDNSCTGQLNHKLRSVLAVMTYYWEISQKKWTKESLQKYIAGQNKIRALLINKNEY